ncbi:uncharacterized protein LOC133185363 [Saccostrea echinata]|uniref:uncharacterized protein LOC133185363 n=1 Tax=Saccostrea echinata TaxID=191078 RepID=UPI002A817446|nr:uncharacterized protein LOC133185363 [Saccostrea echinata]
MESSKADSNLASQVSEENQQFTIYCPSNSVEKLSGLLIESRGPYQSIKISRSTIQKVEEDNTVSITRVKPLLENCLEDYCENSNYCLSQGCIQANETTEEKMSLFDQVIINTMKEHKIKGGSVIIGQQGRILYRQGYGEAAPGVYATSSSKFRIGDISKVITAMAVLRLVDLGYLELTDEVFGDETKNTAKGKFIRTSGILKDHYKVRRRHMIETRRVEHLLQHSGGWNQAQGSDIIDTRKLVLDKKTMANVKSSDRKEMMMRQILIKAPDYKPGTKQIYCHLGYFLLGMVVEEVTGIPYLNFVRDMFQSLGVGDLSSIDSCKELNNDEDNLENLFDSVSSVSQENTESTPFLHGHCKLNKSDYGNILHLRQTSTYCGLIASAEQLFRIFSSIELSLHTGSGILSKEMVKQMLEKPWFENGSEWLGLGLNVTDDGESWGHLGSKPKGTHSLAARHHSGFTWVALFSEGETGCDDLYLDLDTMMKHALSMSPRFSSYSTVLFKQLSFWSMEVQYYGIYSSNTDQLYEVLLPYELLDRHYMNLKFAGYFIQHIDLVSNNGKLFVNIVWNQLKKNQNWCIRKYHVDHRSVGACNTVEKDVEHFFSRYQIHTLSTCKVKTYFHCVIVFKEKTNLKLSQKFLFLSPYNCAIKYITDSLVYGNKVVNPSVCQVGLSKLLTAVLEYEGHERSVPNRYWIAAYPEFFAHIIKVDDEVVHFGLQHAQFYSNNAPDSVTGAFVCFVLSSDIKHRSTCKYGLTRYAFMKTLTDIVRSGEVEVEKICTYLHKGCFHFALVTKHN